MKLRIYEDERYPYVYVETPKELSDRHEAWRANILERQGRDIGPDREYVFVDVPDDLGAELVALRKREAELLDLIEAHLLGTGQPNFRED